jgi:hypothetical protein
MSSWLAVMQDCIGGAWGGDVGDRPRSDSFIAAERWGARGRVMQIGMRGIHGWRVPGRDEHFAWIQKGLRLWPVIHIGMQVTHRQIRP